jgi:hypothetical protein
LCRLFFHRRPRTLYLGQYLLPLLLPYIPFVKWLSSLQIGRSALLAAIIWNRRLVKPEVTDATLARIRQAYIAGPVVYGLSVALALWNAVAGLALCTSLWLLWMRLCYGSKQAAI